MRAVITSFDGAVITELDAVVITHLDFALVTDLDCTVEERPFKGRVIHQQDDPGL